MTCSTALSYSCIAPLVTGFAVIGLFLFYFAFRYNFLFVYDTGVDLKGLGYPRALQHLFVGLYIAEICLLGLFATRLSNVGAIGPFVLMIILIITTALYHVALNSATAPLITFLPKTLEAEEHALLGAHVEAADLETGHASAVKKEETEGSAAGNGVAPTPAPKKKPNMFTKFLKPHVHNDYASMRQLVPAMVTDSDAIDDGLVQDAYLPPSVWAETPALLIPRDVMGVSTQECRDTTKAGIQCSDHVATLNDKNKIVVDDEAMGQIYFASREQIIKEW